MYRKAVLVDPDIHRRAVFSRQLYDIGLHVEPFDSMADIISFMSRADVLFVYDDGHSVQSGLSTMADTTSWVPLVAYSDRLSPSSIVDTISAGALDYLSWPIDDELLKSRIIDGHTRQDLVMELRRQMVEAQQRIRPLSKREKQVLMGLRDGKTNKAMAKSLGISSRTVEIHRANMMYKINADHITQATKLALFAGLAEGFETVPDS